uniref:WD repeat-containing protein 88 isoform X1 n=1 Tax=Podarcis muralis TaxID=64176 RepID=UPI00109FCBA3|nr:WD repeat-containing protein 88 isoform X1 [Podarcis muralis]
MAPPPMVCPDDPLATETRPPQAWEGDHEKLAKIHFKILKGHSAAVTSCHFCFDETKVLSGSYDSTVKLWDIAGAVCIQTFEGEHTGPISECCLSPDNKRLITASYDKSLRAWDTETGKVLWTLEQDGLVTSCHISHDGKYVASSSDLENALFICGVEDAKKVAYVREYHRSTVRRCRFDPQNQRIATVSSDMSFKILGYYSTVYHSPQLSASLVVSGGYDKTIVIWDSREAYKKLCLKGHAGWVTDIALSSNKKWLVSASKDCTLRVWDVADAHEVPVVVQAIRTRGSKLAKCEECKKSFLLFHNDEDKVEINCVFCRLASYKESVPPDPPPLPPLPPDF